ncbi:hypothetical protein V8G54_003962 [Vigna mungo]|uniref:Uncharacterized protein n=1 Tax=Vigna mungo TaxID=3915 RepID=A0AAQ3PF29_VIGMU
MSVRSLLEGKERINSNRISGERYHQIFLRKGNRLDSFSSGRREASLRIHTCNSVYTPYKINEIRTHSFLCCCLRAVRGERYLLRFSAEKNLTIPLSKSSIWKF